MCTILRAEQSRAEQSRAEQSRAEQSRAEQSRADNIDILKAFSAFLIVCIHIPFPGEFGAYVTALARIGVPIFFMITGYFYADVMKRGKELQQIKKIFVLMVEANILYFAWNMVLAVAKNNIGGFLNKFTLKNLLKFLCLNESPFSGHLWYLGAILYVLIIAYLADKLCWRKALYVMTPFLLLGDLLVGKYSIAIWGREFPYVLVRNFLFVGIPYFCIGRMIWSGFGRKIQKNLLIVLETLFAATSLLERFVLVGVSMNATRDHYISTTFLAVAVFLFALKCSGNNRRLALIGRRCSTWLYILHPIFITCIGVVANKIGAYGMYRFIAPFVIYGATLIFLAIIGKCKNILRNSGRQ